MKKVKKALISVSEKKDLLPFVQGLVTLGIEIIATGGTAKMLQDNGIPLQRVEELTGFPEILRGRVKTLHPHIHGALLCDPEQDQATLSQHGISPIDLVIVNLYPFQSVIAQADHTQAMAIEHIDIGGPSMLRSAAKNHAHVTVVIDPEDYPSVLQALTETGGTDLSLRYRLATKVFQHTAQYDKEIAQYFSQQVAESAPSPSTEEHSNYPAEWTMHFSRKNRLRYGENPHQKAALYSDSSENFTKGIAQAEQKQGKPLSYNNLIDADAALQCVQKLISSQPACVIVKHTTPCGVAEAETQLTACLRALETDATSAFGGIFAFNQTLEKETAEYLVRTQFIEVILAPDFTKEAYASLAEKPNIRVLKAPPFSRKQAFTQSLRSISGGLLIQDTDASLDDIARFSVATRRQPSTQERADCLFAWNVVRHVQSNAIVFAKNRQTLGIGAGQTSRVFSTEIALLKATHASLSLQGSVVASDAFYPFPDALALAAKAGATACIQPGGAQRDAEIIQAADALNMAMIFTHTRHFKH
eukprot:TRINITY_DN348_c2_g1_i1.p1 TRINITY_DN348_c2_g1~~TRINITY_DN348_c2_g1_i1.p1  ORF type:complete len:531 (+),score=-90.00 TRINITY_DN348_c2_g1_i1:725-2317(+)